MRVSKRKCRRGGRIRQSILDGATNYNNKAIKEGKGGRSIATFEHNKGHRKYGNHG